MSAPEQLSRANASYQALRRAIAEWRTFLENGGVGEAPRPSGLIPIPAHDELADALGLTPFERAIMLLCAGMELDPQLPGLLAALQRDPARAFPTFGWALDAIPDAHWSAVTPAAPLRHWRLIEVGSGPTLTASPLRIDERTLHHLCGVAYLDPRLRGLVEPVAVPHALPDSYRHHAERLAEIWASPDENWASVQVETGNEIARSVTAAAAAFLGLRLHAVRASRLPVTAGEIETLARLWEREALFLGSSLLIEDDSSGEAVAQRAAHDLAAAVTGPIAVTGTDLPRTGTLPVRRVIVPALEIDEQRALWVHALGERGVSLNGHLDSLIAQFPLDAAAILTVGGETEPGIDDAGPEELAASLWDRCRAEARAPLAQLAERIDSRVGWDDLVLPDEQARTLREIAAHVRQRTQVYEYWGFAARGSRGLGISALFAGASGTGKTLAAEVLANELRLDLFRIDLSQVVSKYIGETEKNLRTLFDAAERSGAILLFDEADALFGRRSEVKDSHDRYANIEVSYLLQRMESYRGLAILTTNQQAALDTAFLRRLRFIVQFPFPDLPARARIWQRVFPASMPREGLDVDRLARLSIAGGNIRNIALHAAFLAAEEERPVTMRHLLQATRSEYAKIDKPLTSAEIGSGGWS